MDLFKEIGQELIKGKADRVKELTQKAIDSGENVEDVLNKGLIATMEVIGVRFKNNEIYIPEVLIAARAMHAGMGVLEPILVKAGVEPKGTVAIGTVKGDLHDIGKNLVAMMLKGAGFKVIDLGIDVPSEKFIKLVKDENKVGVIAMSALLTTTMPNMKETILAFEKEGLKGKVKIMVGGAPITQSYADEIGADGYGPDASTAVEKVKELLGV